MATMTSYHLGGFKPNTPAQNRAEQYDSTAGTYTRWDASGSQVEQRTLTAPEVAALATQDTAAAAEANGATLRQQASAALAGNRTFLALASPTNAQVSAQVKALTQQNVGLIRLLLNQLDGTT